ncbi:MAG: DUF3616 domain-containing protein [Verrucomicrobia bacterium]|nr:DUF3616 domain-containing protein [Verrucomicrobiota bacterium]
MRAVFAIVGLVAFQTAAATPRVSVPLIYRGICDASGAVPVGTNFFAVADDEVNQIRVYRRDQGGGPLRVLDLTPFLEVDPRSPESDLEAGARIGDRAYWIGSHGRNQRGRVRLSRQRFFATAIKEDDPAGVRLVPIGRPYTHLLEDLENAPQLKSFRLRAAARRMPKARGALNIEGLSATPEGHLLIGFRNPIPHGLALLVPLLNPDALLEGHPADLGDPVQLDLDGLGIRDLAFWRGKYLISAGPYNGVGHFRIYEWDGGKSAPRHLQGIHFGDLHPEAVLIYPDLGFRKVQLLSDDGTRLIGGCVCKQLPEAQKRFRSVWVELPGMK